MKKKILVDYFSLSNRWSRRLPKIRNISSRTLKLMNSFYNKNCIYYINLILSDKNKLKTLNKLYKKNSSDTDVLTFVNKLSHKNVGKIFYCDIFFSIDKINKYIDKNNVNFYEHFNHLLIHSLLHINGYKHNSNKEYKAMKKKEILIMQKLGYSDPYKD
tara:strand:- start:527 stop:1003 length:477 start_codon:yes stop_codon:yes gene_type:complete